MTGRPKFIELAISGTVYAFLEPWLETELPDVVWRKKRVNFGKRKAIKYTGDMNTADANALLDEGCWWYENRKKVYHEAMGSASPSTEWYNFNTGLRSVENQIKRTGQLRARRIDPPLEADAA